MLDSKYFSYEDYEEWYHFKKIFGIAWRNGKKIASTELFEYNFDNLGGWAGDLQTLMIDTFNELNGSEDYNEFYNKIYNIMGDDRFSFSVSDLYSDTDSYNIFMLLKNANFGGIMK